MCPGALVKGGGGGSGGGSGNGAGSGDGAGGGGEGGGEGTGGDGRTAASGCTREGEPVDVATGSVVHERLDFQLSGVFSLRWLCTYLSSSCRRNDAGLGHGWSHSFAHRIELGRRHLVLTEADGSLQRLRIPAVGERHHQAFGRFVSRRRSRPRKRSRNSTISPGSTESSSNQPLTSRKSRALVDSTEPE